MLTTPGRLDGLSILIVGGTSGLGLAAARACLREHANVTVVGRDDEDLARAVAELGGGSGSAGCERVNVIAGDAIGAGAGRTRRV